MRRLAPHRANRNSFFPGQDIVASQVDLDLPVSPLRKGEPEVLGFESIPFFEKRTVSGAVRPESSRRAGSACVDP
jgi:hypothetical protein